MSWNALSHSILLKKTSNFQTKIFNLLKNLKQPASLCSALAMNNKRDMIGETACNYIFVESHKGVTLLSTIPRIRRFNYLCPRKTTRNSIHFNTNARVLIHGMSKNNTCPPSVLKSTTGLTCVTTRGLEYSP